MNGLNDAGFMLRMSKVEPHDTQCSDSCAPVAAIAEDTLCMMTVLDLRAEYHPGMPRPPSRKVRRNGGSEPPSSRAES